MLLFIRTIFISCLMAIGVLSAASVQAQSDVFTVQNVPVDVTADTAALARERALTTAALDASRILVERLAAGDATAVLERITTDSVRPLTRGYRVNAERAFANRYQGNLTVAFDRRAIVALFNTTGVPFVEAQSSGAALLVLWEGKLTQSTLWAQAWRDTGLRYTNNLAPLRTIAFDTANRALTPLELARLDVTALGALAQAEGAERILVADASPTASGVRVRLTEVSTGFANPVTEHPAVFAPSVEVAMDRVAGFWNSRWKQSLAVFDASESAGFMAATYSSLADWRRLQAALGGSALVQSVELEGLSPSAAWLSVRWRGDDTQLARELAERGLVIRREAFGWTVTLSR